MNIPEKYIGRVQVLRFIAATAVLFAHLQHEVATRLMPQTGFRPFEAIDGGVGVDLFFVISGFIMYHVSARDFGAPGASRNFLTRRYLRIAPLYYAATLLVVAAALAWGEAASSAQPDGRQILMSLLFIPTVDASGQVAPVLKLGWTLNFEVYFYVVFAIALAFPRRIGLTVMAVVLASVVVAARLLPSAPVPIAFWGQPLVLEFLGGVGVALIYRTGVTFGGRAALALIVGGLVLLIALHGLGLNPYLTRAIYHGVPALMIVLAVVLGPFGRSAGPVQRFLEAGGEASYAIYVMHPFGIRAGALLWQRLGGPEEPWLYIATMMAIVLAGAFAVNILVERPLDKALRNWLRGTPQVRPEPLAPSV